MESYTGLFTTLVLAVGIGYLTLQGFRREAANLKNGTCCGSGGCSCGGNCSSAYSCNEYPGQRAEDDDKPCGA